MLRFNFGGNLANRLFSSLALMVCAVAAIAELNEADQEKCREVREAVNDSVRDTETTCMYSAEKSEAISFRITSSERVFDDAAKRKAWIVAVVTAVGKVMNDHRKTKVDELWVADQNQEKRGIGRVMPVALAKSLQRSVEDGKIGIEQLYRVVKDKLDREEIKNQTFDGNPRTTYIAKGTKKGSSPDRRAAFSRADGQRG